MRKAMNKILKSLEYILIVSIIIVSIIAIFNFIQLKVLKKEYTNFFGHSVFKVISDSMAPSIRKGDIIIVKIGTAIKKQDVITYKQKNDFITHRVLEIKDTTFITRGDSNNIGDVPIPKQDVVGKVVKIFPKLGIWRDIIMTPKIFALLVVTMVLFSASVKDWTGLKAKYKKYKDFKVTNDSIIEGCDKDEKK